MFVKIDNGKIMAMSIYPFDGAEETNKTVIRKEDGTLAFHEDVDMAQEAVIRLSREEREKHIEEEIRAEAQRVPDLEDAVMELAEVVTTETEDNSNAIVDLASYVAEMEARIAALEAAKEKV